MPTVDDVKKFWERNPLYSYELEELKSDRFFDIVDQLKREDVERFAMDYWEFDNFSGQKILDVGCGPGWVTVQYVRGGANAYAIDITEGAVEKTKRHLRYKGLNAVVRQGNAEDNGFPDNEFDFVVSSGVLHHTPDCEKAIRECYRVLKPGGRAKITLYRKGILHSSMMWGLVKLAMKLIRLKPPGADLTGDTDADSLIRQYDGRDNPVGIGKTDKEWVRIMEEVGFVVTHHSPHFFPRRFFPFPHLVPRWFHKLMDNKFGVMIYMSLSKPDTAV